MSTYGIGHVLNEGHDARACLYCRGQSDARAEDSAGLMLQVINLTDQMAALREENNKLARQIAFLHHCMKQSIAVPEVLP